MANYTRPPGFGTFGRFGDFRDAPDEQTTVTIDDIVLDVINVAEDGGWDAPEKRADTGFAYDSYVGQEPLSATVEAWVDDATRRKLESLRESSEPFPASIDHVAYSRAKLENLNVQSEGGRPEQYRVSIELGEIREAELDDAEVWLDTPSGEMGSRAESTNPSIAYPEDDDSGTTEETSNENGIVESLSSFRQDLSGVL
jgi:hypothetical protein